MHEKRAIGIFACQGEELNLMLSHSCLSILQDIRSCSSSLEDLDSRNVAVQAELARQRRLVTLLEEAAMRPAPETEREQVQQQAQLYSQQLTRYVASQL